MWSKQREQRLNGWAWLMSVEQQVGPLKAHGPPCAWECVGASAIWRRPFIPKFSFFPVSVQLSHDHIRVTMIVYVCHSPLILCKLVIQYPYFPRILLILTLLSALHFILSSYMLGMLLFVFLFHWTLEVWAHTLLWKHWVFGPLSRLAVLYPGNRSPILQCTHRRWL